MNYANSTCSRSKPPTATSGGGWTSASSVHRLSSRRAAAISLGRRPWCKVGKRCQKKRVRHLLNRSQKLSDTFFRDTLFHCAPWPQQPASTFATGCKRLLEDEGRVLH